MGLYDLEPTASAPILPPPPQQQQLEQQHQQQQADTSVAVAAAADVAQSATRAALQRGLVPVKRKQPVNPPTARPRAPPPHFHQKSEQLQQQFEQPVAALSLDASFPLQMKPGGGGVGSATGGKGGKKKKKQAAAAAAAASEAAFMLEDYDPAKPNEYEVCRLTAKRRKHEDRMRKYHEEMDEHQEQQQIASPDDSDGDVDGQPMHSPPAISTSVPLAPPVSVPNDASGEDAYMRRLRMSGLSVPPPDAEPPITQDNEEEEKEEEDYDDDLDGVPLITDDSRGLDSRVILLTNMVGPDEVDDSLEDEVAAECAKYGVVEKCIVYEMPKGRGRDDEAVRIFVKFDSRDSAMRAKALDGRFFGGRTVSCTFFPEDRFDLLDLAPQNGSFK